MDRRTWVAAEKILKEDLANLIIIGSEEAVKKGSEGLDVSKATIVDPEKNEKTQAYVDKLVELRAKKGMTPEKARETILNDYTYYGVMMVKMGDADGLVSGACHSTANTLRPCLQILKTKPGTKLVSAFFLMVVPDCEYGDDGVFVFGDCGLNQNPNPEELAAIAESSAESYRMLTGNEPRFWGVQLATELGTIALMANIMREIMALLGAPLFVKYFGRLSPICAGGATTMDTTLPVITRYSGKDLVFISIFHGIIVDFTVPFFVSFFCSF